MPNRSRGRVVAPLLFAMLTFGGGGADAHFQEILPSTDIVPEEGSRTVTLDLVFTHPMEGGPTMDMGQPERFGVLANGKAADLRSSLKPRTIDGKTAYGAAYAVREPGDYVFFLEPASYWEPVERKHILHYAKVVVGFGSGEGWDAMVGFPIEIQPLTRPYGLWTGNLFRGVVKKDGKPLPNAEVEIEWKNDGSVHAPADPFVTQIVKTDDAGIFAYAMPRAGWWAFNAVSEADTPKAAPDGKPAPLEIGGTIWVKAVDMK